MAPAPLVWTRANSVSTTTNTYYDDGALHTQQQAPVGGPSAVTVTLTYDVDGRRQTFAGGTGRTLGYLYNARGGLEFVRNGGVAGSNLASFTYNLAEQRLTRTAGNGILTEFDYDGAGRLNLIDAAGVLRLNFGHDVRDRRKWTKRDSAYGDTYTYHADSELNEYRHQILNPDNPGANQPTYATAFQFDYSGNRTLVQRTGQGASSTLYAAGADNRYDTVNVNGASAPIAHDARGNVTTWDGRTFTYDADNRLRAVSGPGLTMTLDYDGDGRLVKLVKNGTAEYRFYDGAQCFLRTDANGAQLDWTVWGPTPDEVLARQSGGAWDYYHQDPINSVFAVTNAAGAVRERYLYDPFGLPDVRDANWNARSATAIDNPWLFTGQEWRADLGLANYKARWYQPTLGRFMQNDPVRFDAGDVNLYRYCLNDPVNRFDPLGLEWKLGPASNDDASASTVKVVDQKLVVQVEPTLMSLRDDPISGKWAQAAIVAKEKHEKKHIDHAVKQTPKILEEAKDPNKQGWYLKNDDPVQLGESEVSAYEIEISSLKNSLQNPNLTQNDKASIKSSIKDREAQKKKAEKKLKDAKKKNK